MNHVNLPGCRVVYQELLWLMRILSKVLSFPILYPPWFLPLFCHDFPPWMVNWSRCPQVENSETWRWSASTLGPCLPVCPWTWAHTLNSNHQFFRGELLVSGRVLIHTLICMILSSQENLQQNSFNICSLLTWRGFHSTIFSVKHQLSHEL